MGWSVRWSSSSTLAIRSSEESLSIPWSRGGSIEMPGSAMNSARQCWHATVHPSNVARTSTRLPQVGQDCVNRSVIPCSIWQSDKLNSSEKGRYYPLQADKASSWTASHILGRPSRVSATTLKSPKSLEKWPKSDRSDLRQKSESKIATAAKTGGWAGVFRQLSHPCVEFPSVAPRTELWKRFDCVGPART